MTTARQRILDYLGQLGMEPDDAEELLLAAIAGEPDPFSEDDEDDEGDDADPDDDDDDED